MSVQTASEVFETERIQARKKCGKALLVFAVLRTSSHAVGCGNSEVGEVYGTVTLDGEPLPNAVIEFIPTDGEGRNSFGWTDEEGKYDMQFARDRNGAWIGENKVLISTADVLDERDENGEDRYSPELVPEKYSNEVRTVEAGTNLIDFFLMSDEP